ncbi:PREDICTED: kinetochore protein nuf2 [Nelumbo nucifera]|uniref:Kinetochore protein nuf2 n=1 Tax=Nelumbo nucifera TaxID=4432 RepID=A0A1U7YWR4_NELNU|nr:PREDICTED: kinetochore protein nuf2 [Nelumbo nucifera]
MASSFSADLIPRKDIVQILSEYQIANLREEDLINPNSDLVTALYMNILVYIDPLQEDHGQVDFSALEQLENPDYHVDSVRASNLFRKMTELVDAVSCPINFIFRDLVKPDTHRTTAFLSAILNFFLYRTTKLNDIQKVFDQVNFDEVRRQELETQISQKNMEILEHREAREREQPLVLEVDAQVKELRQNIQGLNNHQMSLKTSFRTLREKTKEIDEKISNAEFLLLQSAQENAKLQSKIVQSPEKLQRALEEKKSIQAEVKNSERSAMQSFQEKTSTVEVYSKAHKKMSKNFTQMQEIQEQVNKSKTIDKDVKVIKFKFSEDEESIMSLEAKLVERQRKVEQQESSRKALEKERDLKREEVNKELNHVILDVEAKKHDLQERQRKIEVMVAEGDDITLKINSAKETSAAMQQKLANKCEEIVNEFHNYSNSIGAHLVEV